MKILIIGKGEREHAMLKACQKEWISSEIFVYGNVGMKGCTLVDIDMYDIEAVKNFALDNKIDLTVHRTA